MTRNLRALIPDTPDGLTITRHVWQRAKERGIDETILSAALEGVGDATEVEEQAGDEVLLTFDDPLTADTYEFPLAFEGGDAVLQTAYRSN